MAPPAAATARCGAAALLAVGRRSASVAATGSALPPRSAALAAAPSSRLLALTSQSSATLRGFAAATSSSSSVAAAAAAARAGAASSSSNSSTTTSSVPVAAAPDAGAQQQQQQQAVLAPIPDAMLQSEEGREYAARLAKREARVHAKRKEKLDAVAAALPSFLEEARRHKGCLPGGETQKQLVRAPTEIMQVNIGLLCNLSCEHCHVESSPQRVAENMHAKTVERLLELLDATPSITTVDVTGGAPELNPHFRDLVRGARARGKQVIDRCNLTVLTEPGQEGTAEFLAENGVTVVASLPCYTFDNVEKQRGKGVFDKSVAALQHLNSLGYGKEGTGLELNLVYNPVGPVLPGAQAALEADYKRELKQHFDIVFNSLYTITNMPIKRWADMLHASGDYEKYMKLLVDNFNPGTVEGLMCRNTANIAWDGSIYDCDFNAAMVMPAGASRSGKYTNDGTRDSVTIWNVDSLDFEGAPVSTDSHCFGCTAGAGSSCGGALE